MIYRFMVQTPFIKLHGQSLFGLRGTVTDSITNPLKVRVNSGHDIDSSHVYSNLPIGNYHRYLYQIII